MRIAALVLGIAVLSSPALLAQREQKGEWTAPFPFADTVAIHAHLLPDGRVLAFGGNDDAKHRTDAVIWDPKKGTFEKLTVPETNLFCSGHAFLPDGKLLLAGGHVTGATGTKTLFWFDWRTGGFTKDNQEMSKGRWYPSAVTLRTGNVFVLGGTAGWKDPNSLPQVWQTAAHAWRNLTSAEKPFAAASCSYWYPMTFVVPGGNVFVAGPHWNTYFINASGAGQRFDGPRRESGDREAGSAVQFEPGKILLIGGGGRGTECDVTPELPKSSTEWIDLTQAHLAWKPSGSMKHRRRQMNATILPDGKVLAVGGTSSQGFNDARGAVLIPEMWDPGRDPGAGQWTEMAPMAELRIYHSTSLLLADGRVLVAGSGEPPGEPKSAGDHNHYKAQIYSPPYLFFKGRRPTFDMARGSVRFGEHFTVSTHEAPVIDKVTLLRLGSVTHAFDQSQTFERLTFKAGAGVLDVTAPTMETASPGPFLLFILNRAGVPSEGKVIFLGP